MLLTQNTHEAALKKAAEAKNQAMQESDADNERIVNNMRRKAEEDAALAAKTSETQLREAQAAQTKTQQALDQLKTINETMKIEHNQALTQADANKQRIVESKQRELQTKNEEIGELTVKHQQ